MEKLYQTSMTMDIYSELGAGDEYLKIRQNSPECGEDYLDLARHYEEDGDKDKALELVHKRLEKVIGYLGGLLEYLFNHYEEKRDTAKLEKLMKFYESKKSDLEMMYGRLYNYYKSISDYKNAPHSWKSQGYLMIDFEYPIHLSKLHSEFYPAVKKITQKNEPFMYSRLLPK